MEDDFPFTPAFQSREASGAFEDDDYSDLRKQLFPEQSTTSKQPVLIYLRVRPKSQVEIENQDPDCFQTNHNELIAVPPTSSNTFKNARGGVVCNMKFVFSRIFPPTTMQKDLFNETLKPQLKDFIEGKNCLVFTYGITNSGMYLLLWRNLCTMATQFSLAKQSKVLFELYHNKFFVFMFQDILSWHFNKLPITARLLHPSMHFW